MAMRSGCNQCVTALWSLTFTAKKEHTCGYLKHEEMSIGKQISDKTLFRLWIKQLNLSTMSMYQIVI
uniref:AlNc14C278G10069 protein n=1 Tax=Albugo laibachii Nc14 TaxID=890382 RepID=F0WUR9_9STRA|nr:AlNc14C278G10069 [Albugo laibachii Nc14]|eukprot:CCA25155.1 AlNc14C278G10069 [Albugo laibachii Nc14]